MSEIEVIKNIVVSAQIANTNPLTPFTFKFPINIPFDPDIIQINNCYLYNGAAVNGPFIIQTDLLNDEFMIKELNVITTNKMKFLPNKKQFNQNFTFSVLYPNANGKFVVVDASGNPSFISLNISFIKYKRSEKNSK